MSYSVKIYTRCQNPKSYVEWLKTGIHLRAINQTKPKQWIRTGSMTITSLRGHALAYESVMLTAQDCNIYSAVFAASVLPTPQIPSTHTGQTHSTETMSHDLYCKKCLPWVAA